MNGEGRSGLVRGLGPIAAVALVVGNIIGAGIYVVPGSLAGIAGPLFVALVKDQTGTYAGALPWIAGLLACAAILPAVTRRPAPS